MMPITRPSERTGRQPIFRSRIVRAASSTGSEASAVCGARDITAETGLPVGRGAGARALVASRRSRSVTTPTSVSLSTTGRCRIPWSCMVR